MRELRGARLCWACPGVKIELGTDCLGRRVEIPSALRDIVGEGGPNNEFWILSCQHMLLKWMPFLSATEWHRNSEGEIEEGGFLPLVESL
jgi:hypothetical protein